MKEKTWRYSFCLDRLIRGPDEIRPQLVTRIKPGILQRVHRIGRSRVDRYNLVSNEFHASVGIKYSPLKNIRIVNEINSVKRLSESEELHRAGILIPEVIAIESIWGRGAGFISPWKNHGTLWHYFRTDSVQPYELIKATENCARVIRALHSLPVTASNPHLNGRPESVDDLFVANPGDRIAQLRVQKALDCLRPQEIKDNIFASPCWIHGDCFSYQFLLGEEGESPIWISDWESLRLAGTGLHDLAQLWASLELAVRLNPRLVAYADAFWECFQIGYGSNLNRNCLFRILELQALIRFSPRTWKFTVVVPLNATTGRYAKREVAEKSSITDYDALVREKCESITDSFLLR